MSVYVIVDDSDPNLEYVPGVSRGDGSDATEVPEDGWYIATIGVPAEFLVTRSRSFKVSSTMSYEFTGSAISVFGTIWGPESCHPVACIGSTLSFSIDGGVMATFNTSDNPIARRHVPFFVSSPSLSTDSIHNLTVEVLTPATAANSSNYWIDYLVYEAVVNSSVSTSTAQTSWIFVDDRSPYLEYGDGQWDQNVSDFPTDLIDVAFNSSLTGPTAAVSTVSLNFIGASTVKVYASFLVDDPSDNVGTFSIDNEPPQNISVQLQATTATPNVEIISRAVTPSTSHTIVLKSAAAHSFYLDYVLLESPTAFIASAIPTSSNEIGEDAGTPPAARAAASTHRKVSKIAGGVVGGVAAFIALGAVVFFCLRHRKTRRSRSGVRIEVSSTMMGLDSQGSISGEPRQSATSMTNERIHSVSGSDYTFTATPFDIHNTTSTSHNKRVPLSARTPSIVQGGLPPGLPIVTSSAIEDTSRTVDQPGGGILIVARSNTASAAPPSYASQ